MHLPPTRTIQLRFHIKVFRDNSVWIAYRLDDIRKQSTFQDVLRLTIEPSTFYVKGVKTNASLNTV